MPSLRVSEPPHRSQRRRVRRRDWSQTLLSWPVLTAGGLATLMLLVGAIVAACIVHKRAARPESPPEIAPVVQKVSEPKISEKPATMVAAAPLASAPVAKSPPAAEPKKLVMTFAPPSDVEPRMCGTAIEFASSPAEGARLAKTRCRLQFILHVSGYFDDPAFT